MDCDISCFCWESNIEVEMTASALELASPSETSAATAVATVPCTWKVLDLRKCLLFAAVVSYG